MIKINNVQITNERFPNGELKLNEKQIKKACNKFGEIEMVEYTHESDGSMIELFLVVRYIQDILEKADVRLYLKYMPYSRMDRQVETSAFTLKYLSDWITSWGVTTINVGEAHSDVTPALLGAYNENLSERIFEFIKEKISFDSSKDVVFFPDAGAQKRYHALKYPNLVGFKHRDWETGEIKSLEVCGKVPTKPFKAVIVDDLCSFGGTFLHSAKKLRELGATEVYLVVAHCENNVLKGELINSGLVNRIYTTDSIFTEKHNLVKVVDV